MKKMCVIKQSHDLKKKGIGGKATSLGNISYRKKNYGNLSTEFKSVHDNM